MGSRIFSSLLCEMTYGRYINSSMWHSLQIVTSAGNLKVVKSATVDFDSVTIGGKTYEDLITSSNFLKTWNRLYEA